jgi:hypothetical protein
MNQSDHRQIAECRQVAPEVDALAVQPHASRRQEKGGAARPAPLSFQD